MKDLTLLIALLFTLTLTSQNAKFELSDEKSSFPPQFVVIEKDEMSVEDGYQRTIEWINVTYNTPAEVIKSQIENKYIRIGGFASGLYLPARMTMLPPHDVKYVITFNFKQDKVKFEVESATFNMPPSQYTNGGWYTLFFDNAKMYKKNGKPKYELTKAKKVMQYFNSLAVSFQNYVNKPVEEVSSDDDW